MIRTEQPIKYDKSVDANCTKEEFTHSALGSYPNVSALEEIWDNMPEAKDGKPTRIGFDSKNYLNSFPLSRPIRFFMNRLSDVTGVSGTGKVLNGVILPSGKVVLEWKSPHQTIGIYENFQQFLTIHVESHPDSNEVVFLD